MSVWIVDGQVTEFNSEADKVPNGEYLTIQEYCEMYHFPRTTVSSWIRRGQLEHYILHHRVYISIGTMPKKVRMRH